MVGSEIFWNGIALGASGEQSVSPMCRSAIPEIAGDRAILVNPTDVNAIATQLLKLEKDKLYRKQQIEFGLERVKLFSWQYSAEKLLKVYQSILKK